MNGKQHEKVLIEDDDDEQFELENQEEVQGNSLSALSYQDLSYFRKNVKVYNHH